MGAGVRGCPAGKGAPAGVEGAASFSVALNEHADWTDTEFAARRLGSSRPEGGRDSGRGEQVPPPAGPPSDSLPSAVDWRERGAVAHVKDQGLCGACWAFAAAGAVEGASAIRTGEMVAVSEQELLDCVPTSHGCQGGRVGDGIGFAAWRLRLIIRTRPRAGPAVRAPPARPRSSCRAFSP